jgi:Tat protein translocase TatB subunit
MFFNIGTPELLVILVIALIVVGPRRLPQIGREVGRFMSQLRKVQDEVRDMVKFDLTDDWSGSPETKPVPTPHQERDLVAPDPAASDKDGREASEHPKAEPTNTPIAGDAPEAEE